MIDTESAEVRYTVGVNIIVIFVRAVSSAVCVRGEQRCRGEAHKIG